MKPAFAGSAVAKFSSNVNVIILPVESTAAVLIPSVAASAVLDALTSITFVNFVTSLDAASSRSVPV